MGLLCCPARYDSAIRSFMGPRPSTISIAASSQGKAARISRAPHMRSRSLVNIRFSPRNRPSTTNSLFLSRRVSIETNPVPSCCISNGAVPQFTGANRPTGSSPFFLFYPVGKVALCLQCHIIRYLAISTPPAVLVRLASGSHSLYKSPLAMASRRVGLQLVSQCKTQSQLARQRATFHLQSFQRSFATAGARQAASPHSRFLGLTLFGFLAASPLIYKMVRLHFYQPAT